MGTGKGVEIHGNAVRVWFQFNGERCREIIPDIKPTPPALRYAARLREEIVQKIKLGSFKYSDYFPNSPRAGFVPITAKKSFADIADAWLLAQNNVIKPSSIKAFSLQINWWKVALGHRPIQDIGYLDIAAALGSKEWKSAKTRNNYLIPLRGIFDIAMRDGHITSDPTVKLPRAPFLPTCRTRFARR